MSTLSKEQIKAIVKGNNFQSVTDVTNVSVKKLTSRIKL